MAFEFSLQTAIVGSMGSAALLSATLYYLWRLDRTQRSLQYWALAFAAQTLRMIAHFGIALGAGELWIATDTLFAITTLFIWLGACELLGRKRHYWLVAGILAVSLIWGIVAAALQWPFLVRTLPLYATACAVMVQAAIGLFQLAQRFPGVGYRGLGWLFALLGLHYLDYPFLRTVAWIAPIGFGLAALLMLSMGIAMLVITQRREHLDLKALTRQLQSEMSERLEAEYRYQTLVDELEEGIIVINREGSVVTANPAAARMLAVPLETLRSLPVKSRIYRLLREDGTPLSPAEYPLARALTQGLPCPAETYRLEREDGTSLWLSVNAHPLFRPDASSPYAAIVSFSDVSGRKSAERNLLASELRFRSIFEAVASIAVQGYDRDGQIIYWNDASEHFYGYRKNEALGQALDELLLQPADQAPFRENLERCLSSGHSAPPREYQARRKDGSTISVYSTQVLINNLSGDTEMYCIDIDLSDIHRLQDELRESSERFRALFESSDLGIVVADATGQFVYCNQHYLSLIDATLEEVLDGTWIEHLHPDDRKPMREAWRKALAGQTGFNLERRVLSADGRTLWAHVHTMPMHSAQGALTGYVATIEDITARKNAEEALRHNEAKFRATFDQAFQFIGLMDTQGILLDANRTALTFAGIRPEDVIGKPFSEASWWQAPEEKKKLLQAIRDATNGQLIRFETTHPDASGKIHHIDFSLKPVLDHDGKVQMLIPEGRDITQLKEIEQALRASEARFVGAFNASLDYITLSDIDTGKIIDVNDTFERMTGWTRTEAIGRRSSELGIWTTPESRDAAMAQLKRDGFLREYPMLLGTRSGATIDGLLNASIIDEGETKLLLGVIRDISAQKKAEELRRQTEEKFSRIVHYSPAALVITDAETGRIVDFNRAWETMLGYTHEQVVGKSSLEFDLWVDPADRTKLYSLLAKGNGELDRFECRYRRADGATVYGLNSGRPFEIAGRPCYLWSLTDITLRHELEERMAQMNTELEARVEARTNDLHRAQDELIRSEKLAALGSLVAGIAHELNTPIGNSVTVASTLHEKTVEFSELITDGTLKRSSLNAYLESARTASDLLLRSLSQARNLVASFKQVAVDQTSDQRRKFDLREVVGEVLTTLSPTIRKTPFSVSIDIPEGIVLDSFPGPFGQVVTNFISNAMLHAFEGRQTGTVTLRSGLPEHGQLVMTVADDGNGIPEEHLRRIFDPFFTTKLGKGGSGLGLNIVYNIVTRVLGGKISVESRVGAGTTFMLTMPLCAPVENDNSTTLN